MTQLVATLVMIFAPLGELARLWRALIAYVDGLNAILTDESLSEDLDDPHARAWAERYIAMAEDGIAILITQRTRELLGLPFQRIETRQPAHLPHPPSRERLMARHARMLASLGSIERAAQTRAARIRREASPIRLAPSAQSTSPACGGGGLRASALSPPPRSARGRWIGASARRDGGGSRARGPPSHTIADGQLPIASVASRLRTPPALRNTQKSPSLLPRAVAPPQKQAYDAAHDHSRQNPST